MGYLKITCVYCSWLSLVIQWLFSSSFTEVSAVSVTLKIQWCWSIWSKTNLHCCGLSAFFCTSASLFPLTHLGKRIFNLLYMWWENGCWDGEMPCSYPKVLQAACGKRELDPGLLNFEAPSQSAQVVCSTEKSRRKLLENFGGWRGKSIGIKAV